MADLDGLVESLRREYGRDEAELARAHSGWADRLQEHGASELAQALRARAPVIPSR